jgi:hypothetical protein
MKIWYQFLQSKIKKARSLKLEVGAVAYTAFPQ